MNEPALRFRVGTGYDVHRIAPDRPLVLGGVTIPSPFGLEGHSDADVLTHALADAILGAVGLPDIGAFFPPTDPAFKNMDSQIILKHARDQAERLGWSIGNVDATLIAEAPKIRPHIEAMKARLAKSLSIDPGLIGLKATTNERLGWIGRGEGMAAQAVCFLVCADSAS